MKYKPEQYAVGYIRSLLVLLAVMIIPSSAHALGVADIKVLSKLNQPLHATIPISANESELSQLMVKLGSKKVFARSGMQRDAILDSLIIELVNKGQSPHIKITSKRSIREPMLEFLLSIDWGNGRMLRGFSVFLSP